VPINRVKVCASSIPISFLYNPRINKIKRQQKVLFVNQYIYPIQITAKDAGKHGTEVFYQNKLQKIEQSIMIKTGKNRVEAENSSDVDSCDSKDKYFKVFSGDTRCGYQVSEQMQEQESIKLTQSIQGNAEGKSKMPDVKIPRMNYPLTKVELDNKLLQDNPQMELKDL